MEINFFRIFYSEKWEEQKNTEKVILEVVLGIETDTRRRGLAMRDIKKRGEGPPLLHPHLLANLEAEGIKSANSLKTAFLPVGLPLPGERRRATRVFCR